MIGYGNPGRLDDGLGPAFAERIEALNLPGVLVDSDYQLSVEDAARISNVDIAIFADAAVDGDGPFYFKEVTPEPAVSFTSHSVSPGQVYSLAQTLFHAQVNAYVLGIRGYEFNEFGERLCDKAKDNLEQAVQFFKEKAEQNWTFTTESLNHAACSDEQER